MLWSLLSCLCQALHTSLLQYESLSERNRKSQLYLRTAILQQVLSDDSGWMGANLSARAHVGTQGRPAGKSARERFLRCDSPEDAFLTGDKEKEGKQQQLLFPNVAVQVMPRALHLTTLAVWLRLRKTE